MKIGIDARFYQESGVGRYLRNLISNLEFMDKKNEYFIFLLHKDFKQIKVSKNFQKVIADFTWYGFAEQFKFPKLLNKFKLDLVHFPHFNVPIFYNGKFVVTIHDLIHQHHVMSRATTLDPFTYKIKQFGYKKVFKNAIKKSSKILTPSNFVRRSLIKEWKINDDKIMVTKEAVDDQILAITNKLSQSKGVKILHQFKIRTPFLFYVGNVHPHKNVEGLIRAFLILRSNYQYLQLVLSGYDHYFWQRIKDEFRHEDIIYTGKISDEQLVAFYKSAQAFVMPSFEEGFGIPILESMACNCPVISSKEGALEEVGGDAAIYFDPSNQEQLIEKVSQVLNNEKLRKELIAKGQKRYQQFSWEKLAKQTMEVYESSIST